LPGLGRANVDAEAISQLAARFDNTDLQALLKGRTQMLAWMGDVVLKIGAAQPKWIAGAVQNCMLQNLYLISISS